MAHILSYEAVRAAEGEVSRRNGGRGNGGRDINSQENPVKNTNALENIAAAYHSVWAAHL